jgi:hypothetical protein
MKYIGLGSTYSQMALFSKGGTLPAYQTEWQSKCGTMLVTVDSGCSGVLLTILETFL